MTEAGLLRAYQLANALNAKASSLRQERYAPYYLKALDDGAEMLRDLVLFARERGGLAVKAGRCPRCYAHTERVDKAVVCSRRRACGWTGDIEQ